LFAFSTNNSFGQDTSQAQGDVAFSAFAADDEDTPIEMVTILTMKLILLSN
jgi:hypothetical protein